jgi:hypothetical protein
MDRLQFKAVSRCIILDLTESFIDKDVHWTWPMVMMVERKETDGKTPLLLQIRPVTDSRDRLESGAFLKWHS